MSAQWQSLVTQKIYLASQLARLAQSQSSAPDREACLQGTIELSLRARQLVLALIARYHQDKQAMPASLDELTALTGNNADTDILARLSRSPGSWWQHLEQLAVSQSSPPRQQKNITDDNVIAISAVSGPDRSAEGLIETLSAMKTFVTDLAERHAEW